MGVQRFKMITEAEAILNPSEYLGKDIAFSENDIKFSSDNDFAFITFYNNLGQAIKLRLLTQLAELNLHPNYGSALPDMVQKPKNENTLSKIKATIKTTLLQEPRIDRIVFLIVEEINNIIRVSLEVSPILQKNNLNLVFDLFQ